MYISKDLGGMRFTWDTNENNGGGDDGWWIYLIILAVFLGIFLIVIFPHL